MVVNAFKMLEKVTCFYIICVRSEKGLDCSLFKYQAQEVAAVAKKKDGFSNSVLCLVQSGRVNIRSDSIVVIEDLHFIEFKSKKMLLWV